MRAPCIPGLFPVFDRGEAQARKAAGQAQAEPGLERVRARVDGYLETLAAAGTAFTADDVYALAEADGEPLGEALNLGPLFTAAAKRGLLQPVWCPARPSARAVSHGRGLKVWQGVRR